MDGVAPEIGMRLQDLQRTYRLLKQRRAVDRPAIPMGLLGLLSDIDRLPTGCHARDLAGRVGLDQSTISRAVANLVTHGLVARQADPRDGRASCLVLTEAGRAALSDSLRWYGDVLTHTLDGWTPEEIATFSAGLDRFTAALDRTLTTPRTPEAAL
ncbi:MarR family winged helix-turn-helix transcriptional regulator [Actinoplanes sp. NPDC051851]|uniref:MarR family winged helix-turn-helix transcriptional regulator n=1 Tax=Actinoplanes sp. NPDC051851 TaxID=3154753 RepID=UPI00341D2423